jgi:hypothetical protein
MRGLNRSPCSPAEIADEMEAWYLAGAADGFNLMFPVLPDDWLQFAELVVPELRRRGLTRKEYASGTLRNRLGLPRPASRFQSQVTPANTPGSSIRRLLG